MAIFSDFESSFRLFLVFSLYISSPMVLLTTSFSLLVLAQSAFAQISGYDNPLTFNVTNNLTVPTADCAFHFILNECFYICGQCTQY